MDLPTSDDKTRLTVFSAKGRLEIPDLSLHTIEDHEDNLLRHFELPGLNYSRVEDEFTDLYVCTHGARDCRCADRGGPLAEALRQETSTDPSIRIHEVAHVGKHNLAANVLVYPLGEWLGLLTAEDAPRLVEALRRVKCRPFTGTDPPLMLNHWRGRRGLSKEEQLALFARFS
ncbi:Sucrase/ferredoxin-like-domain-containing protein [Flagelloscypha sp. PMI_526]|nr:Sucrase/ferredoxin-like-domain-containing protein [Flagelloscypha sp. PMI_526]